MILKIALINYGQKAASLSKQVAKLEKQPKEMAKLKLRLCKANVLAAKKDEMIHL